MQVDVKSRKKTSRKDKYFNDDWIWLEYQNVQGKARLVTWRSVSHCI